MTFVCYFVVMARPSSYTPEIVKEICDRLSKGEPLEQICRDDGMPSSRTIRDWQECKVASVPDSVSTDIARARDIGFDVIALNTRDIARGVGESTKDVQRDKLIIDTDLKLLAKWNPKKYGDNSKVEQQYLDSKGEPTDPKISVEWIKPIENPTT